MKALAQRGPLRAPPVQQSTHYRVIPFHPTARRRAPAFLGATISYPVVPSRPVVPADPDFFGYRGLTDVDQFNAGTGEYANSQYDVEPPDQGLCVGNGFVVDAVNNAVAVYNSRGTPLTAPTSLNQFFRLPSEASSGNQTFPSILISDPKCYFDRDTQRWFLSESEITYTTLDIRSSAMLIGMSHSSDPTAGYSIFSFDTTDPSGYFCPCFGDQPLLGADANGLFISINEWQFFNPGVPLPPNGSQIYAMSKAALVNHKLPTVVHVDAAALPNPDGVWSSVQPACAPDTSMANKIRNGTEYFLSALDFLAENDNRIAVWALTNTKSLNDKIPNLDLQNIVVASEAYGEPPAAVQKAGPAPLATSVRAPIEEVSANDDRMNQVVFANGRLWSALNTAVRFDSAVDSAVDAGIAFFSVAPAFSRSGVLTAKIEQQGYIAVAGQNVMFPSIGVNSSGGAIMTATLIGPQYYPTAVYVTPDGRVHIAGPGAGPDDGFSGIAGIGTYSAGRWGDYSAAVADQDGSIWFATEYIPGERTILANWGTFIGHVRTHH